MEVEIVGFLLALVVGVVWFLFLFFLVFTVVNCCEQLTSAIAAK